MFTKLLAIDDPDWKKRIAARNKKPGTPGIIVGEDGKLRTDLPLPSAQPVVTPPPPPPTTTKGPAPKFAAGDTVKSVDGNLGQWMVVVACCDGNVYAVSPDGKSHACVGPEDLFWKPGMVPDLAPETRPIKIRCRNGIEFRCLWGCTALCWTMSGSPDDIVDFEAEA